jgi:hypothetical protein
MQMECNLFIFRAGKNCTIIGHIFVSGLDDHFRVKFRTVHPAQLERQVAMELQVSEHVGGVFLLGRSGAQAMSFHIPEIALQGIRPEIVLVELGSNDIVAGQQPKQLASRIFDIARQLTSTFEAVVGICSVVRRTEKLGALDAGKFDTMMAAVNKEIKQLVVSGTETRIFYHSHKGFWHVETNNKKEDLPVSVWSWDGVHPNRGEGRKRYKNSLRNAISKGLKLMK